MLFVDSVAAKEVRCVSKLQRALKYNYVLIQLINILYCIGRK